MKENLTSEKNPMNIKGIAEFFKAQAEKLNDDPSTGVTMKSLQKTASISSILKCWIQGASSIFKNVSVQGMVENKLAVLVYSGNEESCKEAMKCEKIADLWIMEMVKENSDGTRASSVNLKRQYYDDLKTELMSFDLFAGAEKLEADLEKQKADKKAAAKAKLAKKTMGDFKEEHAEDANEFEEQNDDNENEFETQSEALETQSGDDFLEDSSQEAADDEFLD